jgi:ACR3 family arsenite efflux pump ArsB
MAKLLQIFLKNKNLFWKKNLEKIIVKNQFLWLWLAVMFMFASEGDKIIQSPEIFFILLMPVILFFCINFLVGRLVAKFLNFSFPDSVSLSLTTLARNSPIALAIAVKAFPEQPYTALALVIGPLIELPILAIVCQILLLIAPKSQH